MSEPKSRRRGAALERAILDAAWAELSEVGYGRLTVEGVANRANTSKPVIYRRYSGRAELALAAWNSRVPFEQGCPDTGTLRGDLLELFARVARRAGTIMDEMIAGVMAEAFKHPEVASIIRERLLSASPLADAVDQIAARAAERGEIHPVVVPPRAARVPIDLIRTEIMATGRPLDDAAVTALVDEVYIPLLRGLAGQPSP